MQEDISPQLLRKFLNKECTPEEQARVQAWYKSFENEPDPLTFLSATERDELSKEMFSNVLDNLRSMDQLPVTSPKVIATRWWYYAASGVAAVLLMVAGWVWLSKEQSFSSQQESVVAAGEVVIGNESKSIRRELLPDGSSIWLQPNSSIRYSADFKKATREVHMTGEAFFEVTKDAAHPFIIYTGEVITKVLGTSFNIRAYSNAPSVEVAVVTGKVSVRKATQTDKLHPSDEVLLLPDEKAVFLGKESVLKKELITANTDEPVRIWEKTSVSFDNVPVSEVIKVLNKSYGTHIRVETNELNSYVLKADFSDQNLPDILQMLEKSLNVNYEINNKEIILKTAVTNP